MNDVTERNVRRLMVGAQDQLELSYEEFLRRIASEPAVEKEQPRRRLTLAASLAICAAVLWMTCTTTGMRISPVRAPAPP